MTKRNIIATHESFIPTMNKTGFMTSVIDPISQAFIDYAVAKNDWVLEIGAAYGIATLNALNRGAKIVCNDKEKKHLNVVFEKSKELTNPQLRLLPGTFPEELDFPDNYFSAILICRVLHFFDGETLKAGMKKLYRWLKPGGKLFIVADTPYLGISKRFIPEYEKRVAQNLEWPGVITDPKDYIDIYTDYFPDFIHVLDKSVLQKILLLADFSIETIHYMSRLDYPADRRLDGRESIGAIAYKHINEIMLIKNDYI